MCIENAQLSDKGLLCYLLRRRRCVVLEVGGQNEGVSHTSHRKPVPCVPRCALKVSKDSGAMKQLSLILFSACYQRFYPKCSLSLYTKCTKIQRRVLTFKYLLYFSESFTRLTQLPFFKSNVFNLYVFSSYVRKQLPFKNDLIDYKLFIKCPVIISGNDLFRVFQSLLST